MHHWLVTQHGGTVLGVLPQTTATWQADEEFTLKAEVSGSGTTTIRAKIWKTGTQEPQDWMLTSTDTTTDLQSGGTVGISANRSSSATTTGTYSFSDFQVVPVE